MKRIYVIIMLMLLALLSLTAFTACDGKNTSSGSSFVIDEDGVLISYTGNATKVNIPKEVKTIGLTAFYENTKIKSVTMSSGVTTISDSAFSGCTKLSSITLSDSVSSIGNKAFYGCTSLTSVTIPSGVTNIGERVFENCSALSAVNFGSGITSIPDKAFYNCISLQNVLFPDALESIGEKAFYGCKVLSSVDFPDGLKTIGIQAFYNCPSLTAVYIPSGLYYWGAFDEKKCTIGIKNQIVISATAEDYFSTLNSCINRLGKTEIAADDNVYATFKIDMLFQADFKIDLQVDLKVVYDRKEDDKSDESLSLTIYDKTGYFTGLGTQSELFGVNYFACDKDNLYIDILNEKIKIPFSNDISGSPIDGILEIIANTFRIAPMNADTDKFLISLANSFGENFNVYQVFDMFIENVMKYDGETFDKWLSECLGNDIGINVLENIAKDNVFNINGVSKSLDNNGNEIWKGYIADGICQGLQMITDGVISDRSELCVAYEVKNNDIKRFYVNGIATLAETGGKDVYCSVCFSDFSVSGLSGDETPIAIDDDYESDYVFKKSSSASFEEGQIKVGYVNTLDSTTLNGMSIREILELYYPEFDYANVQEFYDALKIDVWDDFTLNGKLNAELYGNIVANEKLALDDAYVKFYYTDENVSIDLAELFVALGDGEYKIKVKVNEPENDYVRVLKDFIVLNSISELIAKDMPGNDATIKALFNALPEDEFVISVDEKDFTYKRLLGIYDKTDDATSLKTVSFVDTDNVIADEGYVFVGGKYKLIAGLSDSGCEVTDPQSPYYGQKVEFYKEDGIEVEFSYVDLYDKYSVREAADGFGLNVSTAKKLGVLFNMASENKGSLALNDIIGNIFGKNDIEESATYETSSDLYFGIFKSDAEFDEEGNFLGYASASNVKEVLSLVLFSHKYIASLTDAGILPAIKVDLINGLYEKAYGKAIGVDGWCYQSADTLSQDEVMAIYGVIAECRLSRETLEKLGLSEDAAITAALGKTESCYRDGIVYKYLSVFGNSALFEDAASVLEKTDKILNLNIDFAAETNLTGISFSLTVEGLFKTEKSISISCDVEDVNLYKDKKTEFAF